MKAPAFSERQVQRGILSMIRRCFPSVIAHHSPNGAHLAGSSAARFKQVGALKGDGMLKGWPDLAIYWNHGHALIEVKRPGFSPSMVSEDQSRIHQTLLEMGWRVAIVSSVQEAFEHLRERGAPWNGVPA